MPRALPPNKPALIVPESADRRRHAAGAKTLAEYAAEAAAAADSNARGCSECGCCNWRVVNGSRVCRNCGKKPRGGERLFDN